MIDERALKTIRSRVENLRIAAKDLYEISSDFPAVNRNLTRILASVEMLRLNVELPQEDPHEGG